MKNIWGPGGVLWGPWVAAEGLAAIFKLIRNHWFSLCFEPLDPSDAAKVAKEKVEWGTLMQVRSRPYPESRYQKHSSSIKTKKEAKEPKRKPKRAPHSCVNHGLEASQSYAFPEVGFFSWSCSSYDLGSLTILSHLFSLGWTTRPRDYSAMSMPWRQGNTLMSQTRCQIAGDSLPRRPPLVPAAG